MEGECLRNSFAQTDHTENTLGRYLYEPVWIGGTIIGCQTSFMFNWEIWLFFKDIIEKLRTYTSNPRNQTQTFWWGLVKQIKLFCLAAEVWLYQCLIEKIFTKSSSVKEKISPPKTHTMARTKNFTVEADNHLTLTRIYTNTQFVP